MKQIDLDPGGWRSERTKPEPKYPRKTWFGLTDYGPPPVTWQFILTQVIVVVVIVLATTL